MFVLSFAGWLGSLLADKCPYRHCKLLCVNVSLTLSPGMPLVHCNLFVQPPRAILANSTCIYCLLASLDVCDFESSRWIPWIGVYDAGNYPKQQKVARICQKTVKNDLWGIPWTGVYDAGNHLKLQKPPFHTGVMVENCRLVSTCHFIFVLKCTL